MAEGKPSTRQGSAQKRGQPKTSTRVHGSGRAAAVDGKANGNGNGNGNGKGERPRTRGELVDEMEGLFVDAVPESKKSRASRAADRRRARGEAPAPAGVPDTRTSMPARDAPAKSQLSELVPKAFAQATLTCTRGPEEGLSLSLADGSYTVGRARENSFVLKDIAASRRHLRIDVDDRGARVIDLGSGNGTRVNGRRIAEHELKHGDRIEIGGSILLFQERGKPSADGNASGVVDDAQERVIRAAEKLAAELSERMRYGEESAGGFEDGHVAKTRAIPPAQKQKLDQEVARHNRAQAQAQAKPEKLWKETFTNLPLDKIVPADEPLRGPRAAESVLPPPSPQVAQRAPLPRPSPLPVPPPPDDYYEVSASSSRGGGSFMVSLLVTALVVVLGGGAVLTAFIVTRHRATEAGANEDATRQAYRDAMTKCTKAVAAEDWTTAFEAASIALTARPKDMGAQLCQSEAKKHLDEMRKPTLAPAPATPPAPAAPASAAPAPAAAPPEPVAAAAAPPPAPAPPAPAPPAPAPAPVPRRAAPVVHRAAPAAAAPAPRPRPAPARHRSASRATLSDDAAQARFEDAVNALRDKDNKKGCRILEEIADRAQPDSRWKEKAENLYSRRCGD